MCALRRARTMARTRQLASWSAERHSYTRRAVRRLEAGPVNPRQKLALLAAITLGGVGAVAAIAMSMSDDGESTLSLDAGGDVDSDQPDAAAGASSTTSSSTSSTTTVTATTATTALPAATTAP